MKYLIGLAVLLSSLFTHATPIYSTHDDTFQDLEVNKNRNQYSNQLLQASNLFSSWNEEKGFDMSGYPYKKSSKFNFDLFYLKDQNYSHLHLYQGNSHFFEDKVDAYEALFAFNKVDTIKLFLGSFSETKYHEILKHWRTKFHAFKDKNGEFDNWDKKPIPANQVPLTEVPEPAAISLFASFLVLIRLKRSRH